MALAFDRASSERLDLAIGSLNYPMTMAGFFYANDVTTSHALLTVGSLSNRWQIGIRGDAGAFVQAANWNGSSFPAANTASTVTAGTWFHAAGVFTASNSRSVFHNGANKATSTTAMTLSDATTAYVGGNAPGTSAYMDGRAAECALWNVALTDAEVAALAKGISPRIIRPSALVFYVPGVREVIDLKGAAITQNGTISVVDHPRIILPRRRTIYLPAPAAGETVVGAGLTRSLKLNRLRLVA